jgi:hypothetical protein
MHVATTAHVDADATFWVEPPLGQCIRASPRRCVLSRSLCLLHICVTSSLFVKFTVTRNRPAIQTEVAIGSEDVCRTRAPPPGALPGCCPPRHGSLPRRARSGHDPEGYGPGRKLSCLNSCVSSPFTSTNRSPYSTQSPLSCAI